MVGQMSVTIAAPTPARKYIIMKQAHLTPSERCQPFAINIKALPFCCPAAKHCWPAAPTTRSYSILWTIPLVLLQGTWAQPGCLDCFQLQHYCPPVKC